MVFYALVDYAPSGTGPYSVPFPVIDGDHIIAVVAGSDVARTVNFDNTAVTLDADPGANNVRLLRRTPTDPLVVFQQGSSYRRSEDLNLQNTQAQYLLEERYDQVELTRLSIEGATLPTAALQEDIIATGTDSYLLSINPGTASNVLFLIDGAPVQLIDLAYLGDLVDPPTLAGALFYDTIGDQTYIKFSENIPSGTRIRAVYLGGS